MLFEMNTLGEVMLCSSVSAHITKHDRCFRFGFDSKSLQKRGFRPTEWRRLTASPCRCTADTCVAALWDQRRKSPVGTRTAVMYKTKNYPRFVSVSAIILSCSHKSSPKWAWQKEDRRRLPELYIDNLVMNLCGTFTPQVPEHTQIQNKKLLSSEVRVERRQLCFFFSETVNSCRPDT